MTSRRKFASEKITHAKSKELVSRHGNTGARRPKGNSARRIIQKSCSPTNQPGQLERPDNPSYVQEQHTAIREVLSSMYSAEIAAEMPLLYGGSVYHQNFRSYAEIVGVNGLFVDRAALGPKSFRELIEYPVA